MTRQYDQKDSDLAAEAKPIVDYLQTESESLPDSIQQRLHAARKKAIASQREQAVAAKGFGFSWQSAVAGVSLAGIAAVAVFLLNTPAGVNPGASTDLAVNEWELVLTNEDYELLENDLDFYEWLAEQPDPS